ncbi:stress up-regulated Nod 19 protein [Medicago truncatula]|uniref:Stress up-regulated Nod 19 protein n=1 Tax=Medicago truncatula TaxID=3880 RepID=A0A072UQR3_MEDTR|nr:stress up-regulated Nod 19 protein [Medicago truncatula]
MWFVPRDFELSVAILLLLFGTPCLSSFEKTENKIKSAVFLSPKFELGPGSVINRFYYYIDFPSDHIALKSFNAEVVDEDEDGSHMMLQNYDHVLVRNSGICQGNTIPQYFGLGSETRGTTTDIPDPFGIETGSPEEIPEGFEEKWLLNVHAIDTRGTEDKLGCTECKCDLYNVTVDEYGKSIRPDYKGGLLCCYDSTRCKLKEGFEGPKRSLYLRCTVKWVDWDDFIVPVKIYIIDVTGSLKLSDDSKGMKSDHDCKVNAFIKKHLVCGNRFRVVEYTQHLVSQLISDCCDDCLNVEFHDCRESMLIVCFSQS